MPKQQQDRIEKIDLTNCEREQIHLLGHVQAFGCLIATSSDFMINHVSENVQDLLALAPQTTVGQSLIAVFPAKTIHDLRAKLQIISKSSAVARMFGYDALGTGQLFDISIHALGQTYVFEFEPKGGEEMREEMSMVQPLLARVSRAETVDAACKQAAMAMQAMSGFDRVMVYKFNEDLSGEVVAERCGPHMEPFLGLRYPASDIPPQARALYKRSPLRLIADVDGETSPITPQINTSGAPLDLSLAVTRAVSPIHLEYLRNMGVAASMSVSIMKDGELWGLFACHHDTPRYVDYERRTAIELFAQFFSYEIVQKTEKQAKAEDENARRLHDNLMISLSGGTDLIEGFDVVAEELSSLVASDGMAIYSDGRYAARGSAPTQEEFIGLIRFLNTAPVGEVFSTHALAEAYPPAEDYLDRVAGLMSVPISRTPRDYIVFFRREVARSIRWAGNPTKPVEVGPNGVRLTPRKSFEAWNEMVRGTSAYWTRAEQRVAEALRVSLMEIVLKLTDATNEMRRKSADNQELLIAELNHRVRNILNLIQGLVSQGREGAANVSDYTAVLNGRIKSLARAHDQLTSPEWSPSSLRELIEVEAQAYLTPQRDRLIVTGDAPTLRPEAFSTMALVIHELVTNSAKYGALVDSSGKVSINLSIAHDNALLIEWRESGGPPVRAPKRRGFGTTIIESTIPYELKGKVETRYLLGGFEADITLPARYVETVDTGTLSSTPAKGRVEAEAPEALSGEYLVVEDNMVIALDASEILSDAGASEVHMASSVEGAMDVINKVSLNFALLDVNLGAENSMPIAQELRKRDVPFLLATGYGDAESITKDYPDVKIVNKPFTKETLLAAVNQVLSPSEGD